MNCCCFEAEWLHCKHHLNHSFNFCRNKYRVYILYMQRTWFKKKQSDSQEAAPLPGASGVNKFLAQFLVALLGRISGVKLKWLFSWQLTFSCFIYFRGSLNVWLRSLPSWVQASNGSLRLCWGSLPSSLSWVQCSWSSLLRLQNKVASKGVTHLTI